MNSWPEALLVSLTFGLTAIVLTLLLQAMRRAHKKLYQAWLADMTQKNDAIHALVESVGDARAQRDRIQQELHKADAETERLIDENAILKAQVAFLVQERGYVDEASQDTVAPNDTQAGKKVQTIRNARQRKGAAREEP
jgi:hypothetical protein